MLDNAGENRGRLIVLPAGHHVDERVSRDRAFEEHGPLHALVNPDNAVAAESLQDLAGIPLVPLTPRDFQDNRLMTAGAERKKRALCFERVVGGHAPLSNQIVDSTSEFYSDHRDVLTLFRMFHRILRAARGCLT